MFRSIAAVTLALTALTLFGCDDDSGGSDATGTTPTSTATSTEPSTEPTTTTESADARPELGAASETYADAADRINAAVGGGDCDEVNALFAAEYADRDALGDSSCDYLKQISGWKYESGVAFGTGAVLDYYNPDTDYYAAVVLVADPDTGEYRVTSLDDNAGIIETSKTLPDEDAWTATAEAAVNALRAGDFAALQQVGYLTFGIASGTGANFDQIPVVQALQADPDAVPVFQGGTSNDAFFGLATTAGNFTLVEKQQPPSTKLPADAAQYAFVDAYGAP